MLVKIINNKVTLFTLSMLVITVSILFLSFGFFLGVNLSFLLGFATSTLLLGFGMLITSFILRLKTGKVPETKYDERDKLISYISGFTTYIITLFSLCVFLFITLSPKLTINLDTDTVIIIVIFGMSICYWLSMYVYKKIM